MEVHLTPEQEIQFAQLATGKGRETDELVREAIGRYIEEESRFIEAVQLGEAELKRGEYLTHEEVGAQISRLFQS